MSNVYTIGSQRIRLLRWNAPRSGELLVFPDRQRALTFLRRLATDQDNLLALRRLLAEEQGVQHIPWVSHESLLDRLAPYLLTGAIRVEIAAREPLPRAPTGEEQPEARPAPRLLGQRAHSWFSRPKSFSIGIYDQAYEPFKGFEVTANLYDGPSLQKTNSDGVVALPDRENEDTVSVQIDAKKLREAIEAWKKRPKNLIPQLALEKVDQVEPFREDFPVIELKDAKPVRLFIKTPLSRVQLIGGCYFDTAKCFPVPELMRTLPRVLNLAATWGTTDMVIVGHTDTVGGDEYNRYLSLERAEAVTALVCGEGKKLLTWFENRPQNWEKQWGTREIQHMLSVLPDRRRPYYRGTVDNDYGLITDAAVKAFQMEAKLKRVDGKAGRETREALFDAYLKYWRIGLPEHVKGTTRVAPHGCGKHFLAIQTGDNKDEPANRRVEFLLFAGPVVPKPPAGKRTSQEKGDPYLEWVPDKLRPANGVKEEPKPGEARWFEHDEWIHCKKDPGWPSLAIDAHTHIMSGNCTPLPPMWNLLPFPEMSRPKLNNLDLLWEALKQAASRLPPGASDASEALTWMLEQYKVDNLMNLVQTQRRPTQKLAEVLVGGLNELVGGGFDTIDIPFSVLPAVAHDKGAYQHYAWTASFSASGDHLGLAVVLPMDMDFCHLDGYFGETIYVKRVDPDDKSKGQWVYFVRRSGRQLAAARPAGDLAEVEILTRQASGGTVLEALESGYTIHAGAGAAKPGKLAHLSDAAWNVLEVLRDVISFDLLMALWNRMVGGEHHFEVGFSLFETWKQQVANTEASAAKYPFRLLPLYHYEPRRFIDPGAKNTRLTKEWEIKAGDPKADPFMKIAASGRAGVYAGFKMYTSQGYMPADFHAATAKVLRRFFKKCAAEDIPIMTHCTPAGFYTHHREHYLDFWDAQLNKAPNRDVVGVDVINVADKREDTLDGREAIEAYLKQRDPKVWEIQLKRWAEDAGYQDIVKAWHEVRETKRVVADSDTAANVERRKARDRALAEKRAALAEKKAKIAEIEGKIAATRAEIKSQEERIADEELRVPSIFDVDRAVERQTMLQQIAAMKEAVEKLEEREDSLKDERERLRKEEEQIRKDIEELEEAERKEAEKIAEDERELQEKKNELEKQKKGAKHREDVEELLDQLDKLEEYKKSEDRLHHLTYGQMRFFQDRYVHPDAWLPALKDNKRLRLCLAHFASDAEMWGGVLSEQALGDDADKAAKAAAEEIGLELFDPLEFKRPPLSEAQFNEVLLKADRDIRKQLEDQGIAEKYLAPDAWRLRMSIKKGAVQKAVEAMSKRAKKTFAPVAWDEGGVPYRESWVRAIIKLCKRYVNVYTDISFLDLLEEDKWKVLAEIFYAHPHMLRKTMFGTDWYVNLKDSPSYRGWYESTIIGLERIQDRLKGRDKRRLVDLKGKKVEVDFGKMNLFYQLAIINPLRFYRLPVIAPSLRDGLFARGVAPAQHAAVLDRCQQLLGYTNLDDAEILNCEGKLEIIKAHA